MGKIVGKRAVTVYLLPREHANLITQAKMLGIENSEAAAIAIQLLMEAPFGQLRERLKTNDKGRPEPYRKYDPSTGQVFRRNREAEATPGIPEVADGPVDKGVDAERPAARVLKRKRRRSVDGIGAEKAEAAV